MSTKRFEKNSQKYWEVHKIAEELLKEDKSFGKNPKAFEKALKSRLEARGHKMNPLMLLIVKLVLKAILELLG